MTKQTKCLSCGRRSATPRLVIVPGEWVCGTCYQRLFMAVLPDLLRQIREASQRIRIPSLNPEVTK